MREHETHRQLVLRALQRFELKAGRKYELAQEVEAEMAAEMAALEAKAGAERVTAADADESRTFPWSAKAKPADLPPWPKKPRGRGYVRVLDPKQVDAFAESIPRRHGGYEERQRATAIVKRIREAGAWKRTLSLPPTWRRDLDELEVMFPNFASVIDYLRATFALAEKTGRAPVWTPAVLDGAPGIGKTFFAIELARRLGVLWQRVDMSSTQTGMTLAGGERHYNDSQFGVLFDMLALGKSASPLIVIDEIDKAAGDDRFPATGALYALLEPRTAASFRDQSIPEIELDASGVLWIATSNDAKRIPAPILSRMRVFSIPRPSGDASRELVQRMYRKAGEKYLPDIELPELDQEVLDRLSKLAPRTVEIALQEAFGRAAYEQRQELRAGDFPEAEGGRRKVGFV